MKSRIASHFKEHLECFTALSSDSKAIENLIRSAELSAKALGTGGKILFCGNGGSAADAQHYAAELVVRLEKSRNPFTAIALTTDSSIITAAANDFGYDTIFARQVLALGRKDDVLVAISTSGNSPSILNAIEVAHENGIDVIGFTGSHGGKMASSCDVLNTVPSNRTMRIQEMHSLMLHIFCELVETIVLEQA